MSHALPSDGAIPAVQIVVKSSQVLHAVYCTLLSENFACIVLLWPCHWLPDQLPHFSWWSDYEVLHNMMKWEALLSWCIYTLQSHLLHLWMLIIVSQTATSSSFCRGQNIYFNLEANWSLDIYVYYYFHVLWRNIYKCFKCLLYKITFAMKVISQICLYWFIMVRLIGYRKYFGMVNIDCYLPCHLSASVLRISCTLHFLI